MSDKAEMFNIVCDSLCKYSEMNTGNECELSKDSGCPLSELVIKGSDDEKLQSYAIRLTMAVLMKVKSINESIPLANNEYVRSGYAISLDII